MGSNIIELAKLGHERAAELKASCGAVDVRSLAQLISDLATQIEVQFVRAEESQREFRAADATIHNLELKLTDMAVQLANAESKCRELAVECKTLSRFISGSCYVFDGDHDDYMPDEFIDASHYMPIVTPATDAFLAEVRAQAVEMFALQQRQIAADQERSGDYEFSRHCSISAAEACEFAEELREGKCCEVQS
ncbi:hypothetical protein ABMQ27_001071 [Escherichia coli]|nr:hypothetical protein [Escherichia coli]HAM9614514.1 hypothetical protein [Escherichia coli]